MKEMRNKIREMGEFNKQTKSSQIYFGQTVNTHSKDCCYVRIRIRVTAIEKS